VEKIRQWEKWEEFKLQASFYLFMGSAAYLFLKRFYLEEILFAFFYSISAGVHSLFESLLYPLWVLLLGQVQQTYDPVFWFLFKSQWLQSQPLG